MNSSADRRLQALMVAIQRAVARTEPGPQSWHVCVRNPEDHDLISFKLSTYKEVEALAAEISELGYELTLMHPVHTQCDFVLEPGRVQG